MPGHGKDIGPSAGMISWLFYVARLQKVDQGRLPKVDLVVHQEGHPVIPFPPCVIATAWLLLMVWLGTWGLSIMLWHFKVRTLTYLLTSYFSSSCVDVQKACTRESPQRWSFCHSCSFVVCPVHKASSNVYSSHLFSRWCLAYMLNQSWYHWMPPKLSQQRCSVSVGGYNSLMSPATDLRWWAMMWNGPLMQLWVKVQGWAVWEQFLWLKCRW